jgi:nucleoside-diphosphate-sugar epimerase
MQQDAKTRTERRVFVAGCGYVGLATGKLLHSAGWKVVGGSRSGESAGAPFPVVPFDLSDPATMRDVGPIDIVVHCASSSRGGADQYRQVYLDGVRNLLLAFGRARVVFTSSTSVYAQTDGSIVTEESPAMPSRETGKILREAENLVLQSDGCVARLAGIYGPGRSVLLRRFFTGEAVIEGDGERYVNQIHRDDAASALVRLLEASASGVYNVSDDTPLSLREVYSWLAAHFGKAVPPTGPVNNERKRGVTHKRVSNAKIRALGWFPRYPSFRDAVVNDPDLISSVSVPPEP